MPSDSSTLEDSDDIDLGWDDEPRASIAPRLSPPPKPSSRPRYSLRPVSVAPRPTSSSPSPENPTVIHVEIEVFEPEIPTPSPSRQEFLAAPPVALLDSEAPPASSEWPDAGTDEAIDSLGPSQLDALPADAIPAFRAHGPRRTLLAIGSLASAGLIWFVVGSNSSAPNTVAELPRPHPATEASPAPVALPPPAAPSPTGVTAPPGRESTAPSATTNAPSTIPVAVHISPPEAFVFESGRRLGRGDVTVDVTPGTKVTLVAQLRGYSARTVVLDGTYTSVNIALRRASGSRKATAEPSTPPASADATPPAPVDEIAPL